MGKSREEILIELRLAEVEEGRKGLVAEYEKNNPIKIETIKEEKIIKPKVEEKIVIKNKKRGR